MIVDKPQKALLLLEHVERKETPGLKMVILMEPFEESLTDRGQGCGVVIKSMQAVEVRGCLFWAVSGPPSQSCQLSAPLRPRVDAVGRQAVRLHRARGG